METVIHKFTYQMNNNHFYIKRDDLLSRYLGGNKARIVREYYIDMIEQHCNCLIVYGSRNSNMCRAAALMCAEKGIPCFVIYGVGDTADSMEGINDVIVKKAGADIISCAKEKVKETVESVLQGVKEAGYTPYYVFGNSMGKGNEKVGMKGYVSCYDEIWDYEKKTGVEFDYIFVTSGTGITQSGLIAGKVSKLGRERIVGVSIARKRQDQERYISYCLGQYFGKNWQNSVPGKELIEVYDGALQGGYGKTSVENKRFMEEFWVQNGIPIDNTYIGKGMFGTMQYLKEKQIYEKNILFIHTGATPLFYEEQFRQCSK